MGQLAGLEIEKILNELEEQVLTGRLDSQIIYLGNVIEGVGKQYGKIGETKFQMEVADALNRIVRGKVFVDEELGEVVVLENLGILFEPGLGIDVVRFLRKVSKITLTVLLWPGEIGEDRLYFLNRESEITLKQTDINYITI